MIGKTNSLIKNAIALEFDCITYASDTYDTGIKINNVKAIALQYQSLSGTVISEYDTVINNTLNKVYATVSTQTGTDKTTSLEVLNGNIHFVQKAHGGLSQVHTFLTAYY